jgi:hypothetical protein
VVQTLYVKKEMELELAHVLRTTKETLTKAADLNVSSVQTAQPTALAYETNAKIHAQEFADNPPNVQSSTTFQPAHVTTVTLVIHSPFAGYHLKKNLKSSSTHATHHLADQTANAAT